MLRRGFCGGLVGLWVLGHGSFALWLASHGAVRGLERGSGLDGQDLVEEVMQAEAGEMEEAAAARVAWGAEGGEAVEARAAVAVEVAADAEDGWLVVSGLAARCWGGVEEGVGGDGGLGLGRAVARVGFGVGAEEGDDEDSREGLNGPAGAVEAAHAGMGRGLRVWGWFGDGCEVGWHGSFRLGAASYSGF